MTEVFERKYVSPDRSLTFIITYDGNDYTLGFEDGFWHTHGRFLTQGGEVSEAEGVRRCVADLLGSRTVIAIKRLETGQVIRLELDPAEAYQYATADYLPPGTTIEYRYWDGRPWRPT